MLPEYYYNRPTACWWGFWTDANGFQVGDAIHDHNKDQLLIELGKIHQDRYDQLMNKNK